MEKKTTTMSIKERAEALEFPLIPMDKIRPEIKDISVAWHENATNWIGDKVKLASDIQNYADWYATHQTASLEEMVKQYKTLYEELDANQEPLENRAILAEARIKELEGALKTSLDMAHVLYKKAEILNILQSPTVTDYTGDIIKFLTKALNNQQQ